MIDRPAQRRTLWIGEEAFDIRSIVGLVCADQVLTEVRQPFVEPVFFRQAVANEYVLVEAEEMLEFMGQHGIGDFGIVERIVRADLRCGGKPVELVAVAPLALGQDRRGMKEPAYHGGIVTHFVNQVGVEQKDLSDVGRARVAYERRRDNGMGL